MANTPSVDPCVVRCLTRVSDAEIEQLAALLIDCVAAGASVSFMHPLPRAKAQAFWRDIAAGAARGERALLVAQGAHGIVGTVQLILAQPENQPHRADLAKLLVLPHARRRGIGAALMRGAEGVARQRGKSLLVLDTASSEAQRLYANLGWRACGVVPGYALLPHGGLCDTTFFFRDLIPE